MFSILVVALLTTVDFAHVNAGTLPGLPRGLSAYGSGENLHVYSYHADNAQFYLITVYHATDGYINSITTTVTSTYIPTRKCGRSYNVTVTAVNSYGSGQPRWIVVSSGRSSPSIREPQKTSLKAILTWTNGCNTQHDLYIVDQNSIENRVTSVHSPYTLNMQPNMLYTIKVIAVYENGEIASSLKYITTGYGGIMTSITSVPAFCSLHITWAAAEFADSYQISISSVRSTTFNAITTSHYTNKFNVSGMKTGTRYRFSIKAVNKLGEGPVHTQYLYTASDIPLIQRVSVSRDGTTMIEWTKAKDNDNYYLYIRGIAGSSYYSGQVTDSVYTWNANSVSVNAYAYVTTRDYDSNRNSNYFYFGNVASRPVITSVVQTGRYQLRVAATTFGNADRIRINVYSYYTNLNGNPVLSSWSSIFRTTSPWLASTYPSSGMKNYIYYVTVFVDNDRDGNYETSSDTFVYREETSLASVSVVQVPPYMARISLHPAAYAIKHILFIDNNRTEEQLIVTSPNNSVMIHKLAGSLKLSIRLVAVYEVGNASSTHIFQGKCEKGSCAGNASCTLDKDYKPICFCEGYFLGDGRTGCFPFCRANQVGSYNFTTVPAGQVAYSEDKCVSGRSNASVLCEVWKYGTEFRTFFSSLKAVDCDFELENITSEAYATTTHGSERICRIFEVAVSKISLIEHSVAKTILNYLEKLADLDTKMSSQGLKHCLLTASHLTSYLRVHHDQEDTKKLLKTLPRLFRNLLDVSYYYSKPRDFKWISDNIFAQVTDVPTHLARVEGNFSILSEFLSPDGSGRPEYPVETIIPLASVVSVQDQMSRETECSLNAIRVVFLAFRDSTLFPRSSSSDRIAFLEMGTRKRPGKMNATQNLLIRKSFSKSDNSSKSAPLSEFYCGAFDAENFLWKKDACSPSHGETEGCECHQFGYYGILKNDVLLSPIPYQMQSSDVAGSTVVVATMIITIFFLLSKKKLRNQHDIQALLHVLFTSSISHVVYVSGIGSTTPVAACVAVSWLLHFFVFCSWTWVSVFVYTSYASMKTENVITSKSACIGTALAYIIPFCVTVVNGGITLATSMTSQEEKPSGRQDVCFVQGYSLYFAFIFPAAVEFSWISHSCFCIWKLTKDEKISLRMLFPVMWAFSAVIAWTSAITAALTASDAAKWIFFAVNMIQAIVLVIGNRYVWRQSAEQLSKDERWSRNPYEEEHPNSSSQVNENHAYEDINIYENM